MSSGARFLSAVLVSVAGGARAEEASPPAAVAASAEVAADATVPAAAVPAEAAVEASPTSAGVVPASAVAAPAAQAAFSASGVAASPPAFAPPTPAVAAPAAPAPGSDRLLRFRAGEVGVEIPVSLAGRVEDVSSFPVDRYGTKLAAKAVVSPQARLGLRLDAGKLVTDVGLAAEYEQDFATGTLAGKPALKGTGLPNAGGYALELRKALVRASFGDRLRLGGGVMTNHWGLGLVANDGAHGWEPGSARFTDPRGGDRVLRGFVSFGPVTGLGLAVTLSADRVWEDDVLLTPDELPSSTQPLAGDKATQFVAALTAGQGKVKGGLYIARRDQEAPDSGARLKVTAVDATGRWQTIAGPGALTLEGEAALVTGTTTLGPTPEIPTHKVRQLGAALRASYAAEVAGAVLDLLFASGDRNADDEQQNAFKADPNYETGLLLFRHVLAAQSGHATATAGDPMLVGAPAPGLERVPTRGSATNTIAIFPRGFWRPVQELELYGGPLFAFAEVASIDPFNTRIAGGAPRNALDGKPGRYLGTEIDLGARYRATLAGTTLTAGVEGAVLKPGSALRNANGGTMKRLFGGRFILAYRL